MANTRPRQPRKPAAAQELQLWPVDGRVELKEFGSCWLPVKLAGLSVTKAHLDAGFRSIVGRRTDLRIPGFALLRGTIVEAQNWQIHVAFDTAIHPYIFHHIVSAYRSDPEQAELLAFTTAATRRVSSRS